MKCSKNGDKCKEEIKSAKNFRKEVPSIVDKLVSSCSSAGCFDHVSAEPIPHREAIIDILHRLALILYPGYFIRTRLDSVNLEYYMGEQVTALYEVLSEQIILSIRHDCIRHNKSCVHCEPLGYQLTVDLQAQTVSTPDGEVMKFEVDPFRKHCLLEGLDDIGLTLRHADAIRAYEERRRGEAPWLFS